MSRSRNSRKGSKNGKCGREYWKSRLYGGGGVEMPGRYTKKRTAKIERQKDKDICKIEINQQEVKWEK